MKLIAILILNLHDYIKIIKYLCNFKSCIVHAYQYIIIYIFIILLETNQLT